MDATITQYASLEDDRKMGDPELDALMHKITAYFGDSSGEQLELFWAGQTEAWPEALLREVHYHRAKSQGLPLWANTKKMELAHQFFLRFSPEILLAYWCGGLTFLRCCLDTEPATFQITEPGGAREVEVFMRLLERSDWRQGTPGMSYLLKQRWSMALERVQRKKAAPGQVAYNQEELAAWMLACGCAVTYSMKKMGLAVNREEVKAWVHFWNVLGYQAGVRQRLLPLDEVRGLALIHDIFEHRCSGHEMNQTGLHHLLSTLEDIWPGNQYKGAALELIENLCPVPVLQKAGVELSIIHRTELYQRCLALPETDLQPDYQALVWQHLGFQTSQALVTALSHYYHRDGSRFQFPEYTGGLMQHQQSPVSVTGQQCHELSQAAIQAQRWFHHCLQRGETLGYFALSLASVISQAESSRDAGHFENPGFLEECLTRLARRSFRLFEGFRRLEDPPFAWKLALDANFTALYYPEQYLYSALAVHIKYDLVMEAQVFLNGREANPAPHPDFLRLLKLYQQCLPDFEGQKWISLSGEEMPLNNRVARHLKNDLSELSPHRIWEEVRQLPFTEAAGRAATLQQMKHRALDLSQRILSPSGLWHSVLKSQLIRPRDHQNLLLQYYQSLNERIRVSTLTHV